MAKKRATQLGSGASFDRVAVDTLQVDQRNARRHGMRNLEAVKESLRRFGQQRPIVVDAAGVVLAGNATLLAARELGWTAIDIMRTTLKGKAATEYAVADNRTAELAEWDTAVLDELAKEVDLSAFFTQGELDALVGNWQVDAVDMAKLEEQQEMTSLEATLKVTCAEQDREEVLAMLQGVLAAFHGARVE
jgi:hypothetical protein